MAASQIDAARVHMTQIANEPQTSKMPGLLLGTNKLNYSVILIILRPSKFDFKVRSYPHKAVFHTVKLVPYFRTLG